MPPDESKTVLLIVGMCDNGCREAVVEALERVVGVVEVHVNLYRGHAIVRHGPQCQATELVAAVACAGCKASLVFNGHVHAAVRGGLDVGREDDRGGRQHERTQS